MKTRNLDKRWIGWAALAVGVLLLGACVQPHETRMEIDAPARITVAEGTRLAALAMQDIGFWPKMQNEAAGLVVGEKTEKITLGWETMTLTLQASVGKDTAGKLKADAKVEVSKNMAFYTGQSAWVEKFQKAFQDRLAAWTPPPPPAPPPARYSPAPRYQTTPTYQPAPAPGPSSPAREEFDL